MNHKEHECTDPASVQCPGPIRTLTSLLKTLPPKSWLYLHQSVGENGLTDGSTPVCALLFIPASLFSTSFPKTRYFYVQSGPFVALLYLFTLSCSTCFFLIFAASHASTPAIFSCLTPALQLHFSVRQFYTSVSYLLYLSLSVASISFLLTLCDLSCG